MYNISNKDYNKIHKLFNKNIENYKKEYNSSKDLLNKLINIINKESDKLKEKYNFNFDIINNEIKNELFENYNIEPEIYNSTSELINNFIEIDEANFFINALNKTIMDLIVSNLLDNFIKQSKKSKENTESINTEEIEEKCR